MFTSSVVWLWVAGLLVLAAGLLVVRRELVTAQGLDKLIALGPVFVASPLAVFAAEHFVDAKFLAEMVPVWMPARLFWAYLVGVALLSAAISFIAMKYVPLSATLLGVMFLIFVSMLDLPFAIAHPGVRIGWSLALRETAFAGGAWALAGNEMRSSPNAKSRWMIVFGRCTVAVAVIFFGIQQLLHPEFLPGVPDRKLTPAWIPLHAFWGYPVGACLLVAGIALLLNKRPRTAATWIGIVMTLLTVFLYLPILFVTHQVSDLTEAINYVADTLMFGGTGLLVAKALPQDRYRRVPWGRQRIARDVNPG